MQKSGYLERRALKKAKPQKVRHSEVMAGMNQLNRNLDDYERSMPTRSFSGTYNA